MRSGWPAQLERWDVVAAGAAILNGAGVWTSREHGWLDEAFIAILTEAAEHLDGAERATVLARCRWSTTTAGTARSGTPSVGSPSKWPDSPETPLS